LARQAVAHRVALAAWSVQLSGHPHSGALPARRDAAVVPSCFRRVEEAQRPAALSGPAWWQVPAAASHQPAGAVVVESSVRPAASVPQVRLPAEEAAVVWGAKVQPQEAAEVLPGPSAQQPVAAEEARVVSAAEAQPREAAEAASDAEEARQPVAAAGALDAVAEPQQAVVAAEPDAVAAQLPGVAAEGLPDGEVPQQEAGHPSAPPSWRPGGPRLWLARRQVERSAHAMRRSRVASPSRQSWRAAGCEGLS
jgi:hypothetical protein